MIRCGIDFKPSVSLHVHKIKANQEKLHDEHAHLRFCICMVNSKLSVYTTLLGYITVY